MKDNSNQPKNALIDHIWAEHFRGIEATQKAMEPPGYHEIPENLSCYNCRYGDWECEKCRKYNIHMGSQEMATHVCDDWAIP